MKKNLEQAPDLEQLAGQPFQILDEKSKSRPCKTLASLNLESGTTFFTKKEIKREKNKLRQSPTTTVPSTIVPCTKRGIYPSDRRMYPRTTGIKLDLCICTIPTVGFYRKHGEVSLSLFITIY
jgi:hypothetical protein